MGTIVLMYVQKFKNYCKHNYWRKSFWSCFKIFKYSGILCLSKKVSNLLFDPAEMRTS